MHWLLNTPSIIMLHHVSNDSSLTDHGRWVVSHESYIRLLDYLQEHGYRTMGFEDITKVKSYKRTVILTFDDCACHLWDFAIPELIKRKMKAVFYIPTAHIGGHNNWDVEEGRSKIDLMDEGQVKQLISVGMEVGAHAHEHIQLRDVSSSKVLEALKKSKQILESILQRNVPTMAYPFGSIPANYQIIVRQAGYEYALAVFAPWQNRYSLRRWIYDDGVTDADLNRFLNPAFGIYRSINDKWIYYKKYFLQKLYMRYSRMKSVLKDRQTGQ